MADAHGSHGPTGSHGASSHGHAEPAEDPLRTPGWLPLLGLGLLVAGALGVYLFLSPGVMSASYGADAGADAEAADAAPAAH